MIEKKSKKANLERRKNSFLQLGFIVAISFTLVAFEWSTPEFKLKEYCSELSEEEVTDVFNVVEIATPKAPKPITIKPKIKEVDAVVVSDEKVQIEKEITKEIFEDIDPSDIIEESAEGELEIENVEVNTSPVIHNAGSSMFDGILPHYSNCEGLSSEEMFACISDQINNRLSPRADRISSLSYTGPQKVTVFFVVDEQGDVSEVVIRGEEKFEKDLIKEVKRSVFALPQMIPGSQGSQPIKARFTLPISFTVQ